MIDLITSKQSHDLITNQIQSQYRLSSEKTDKANVIEFEGIFADKIKETNELQYVADVETQKFITGESDNIHDVMIAMEEATVSLQFVTQVRNKMVEAYQEIKNMQI